MITPISSLKRVEIALSMLRAARELLKTSEHPRATAKVRLAIASTEGALRHHMNRDARERRQAR